ncbi:MAG: magnesium and cobalt transport protein CorA [Tannerellaceae bacterium]|nr:magnesium and cobalt transport protein CorA [Tannerellaceae bacterium]
MISPNNRYFADKYHYSGEFNVPTTIRLIRYRGQLMEHMDIPKHVPSFKKYVKDSCINWFSVRGLTDSATITRMVEEFGLLNLDVRDILTPNHIVKVDVRKDCIFTVMNSCAFNAKGRVYSEHVCIIVTSNIVISFNESERDLFPNVEHGLRENIMDIRYHKSGMLFAFLLNGILGDFIETTSKVEKMLEKIEDLLLNPHASQTNVGLKIQKYRRAYLIIRKNTQPLTEEAVKLVGGKEGIIDEGLFPVFNELSDQLQYILQTARNSNDILSSLVDLYVSKNDLNANIVMKRLTVVATLFIPITFLVGVWGMNFDYMPELKWRYGYLFAWGVLLVSVGVTWWFMQRKKWF